MRRFTLIDTAGDEMHSRELPEFPDSFACGTCSLRGADFAFLIATGLFYRLPLPVQPMKAVSAVILTAAFGRARWPLPE